MKNPNHTKSPEANTKLTGYPNYPEGEDIYKKETESQIDPEKLAEVPSKTFTGAEEESLKKGNERDHIGIDVPGAELDDAAEDSGNEDEENNYYSLGGDANSSLDEENSDK